MVETTSFPTDNPIGTVGTVGRDGIAAIVLPCVDEIGNKSRRWVTYKTIEALGLEHVPVDLAIVMLERIAHNVTSGDDSSAVAKKERAAHEQERLQI